MTEKEMYQLTIVLWQDMADHGFEKKESRYWKNILSFENHCPLCELYCKTNMSKYGFRFYCDEKCPLNLNQITCFDDNHPFDKWQSSKGEAKKNAAQEIANLVQKGMERL